MKSVVIAGGTGYLGRTLAEKLSEQGLTVYVIARPQSVGKVPPGCEAITGDVLDASTYRDRIPAGATFVHLVGVAHPAPWKGAEFRRVDLASLAQSVAAAKHARAAQFIFVSVAHPAPVMKAYIEVRSRCEQIIRESGLPATILRPWYILGPGHRWPYVLLPVYKVLESFSATREGAIRLGLVARAQMVAALTVAVESEHREVRIVETAGIRAALPDRSPKPLRLAPR